MKNSVGQAETWVSIKGGPMAQAHEDIEEQQRLRQLRVVGMAHRHSPVTGCPPSYLGGSQTRMAQSSPTDVTRTASGGSGTSGRRESQVTLPDIRKPPTGLALGPLLTHNPQEDGGHILAHGVGDFDGVASLISALSTLNDEAAAVHTLLDAGPALGD